MQSEDETRAGHWRTIYRHPTKETYHLSKMWGVDPEPSALPSWNQETGSLWIGGELVTSADHTAASALRTEIAEMEEGGAALSASFHRQHEELVALRAALTEAQAALKKAQGKVHYLQHNSVYGTAETCAVPECAALHTPPGAGTAEAIPTSDTGENDQGA